MEIVQGATVEGSKQEWIKRREAGGPRLLSCSDDLSVKVWRRRPRDRQEQSKYSIIRTGNNEEDWVEEATLPRRHSRAVYSVAWSKMTGMIVSTGGDGKIVVYNERWKKEDGQAKPSRNSNQPVNGVEASKVTQDGVAAEGSLENSIDNTKGLEDITTPEVSVAATEWMVVAEIEGAHGVFEINHVCWAKRADRGKRRDDEEVILSTGDDGLVKVWTLDV
jgi:WD40 repeat protein